MAHLCKLKFYIQKVFQLIYNQIYNLTEVFIDFPLEEAKLSIKTSDGIDVNPFADMTIFIDYSKCV